jgi:hypothetical protein
LYAKASQTNQSHLSHIMRQTPKEPVVYPTRLYKYRSLAEGTDRTRTLQIIEKNELWYSKASGFNDPFDCSHMIAGQTTEEWAEYLGGAIDRVGEEARVALSKLAQKKFPQPKHQVERKKREWTITTRDKQGRELDTAEVLNSVQEKHIKKLYQLLDKSFGVLSLSEKPDDILMWSHYSNSHDGICLEYDPSAHPKAFPRLNPVRYQESYPYFSWLFPNQLEMMLEKGKASKSRLLLDTANILAGGLADEAGPEDDAASAALGVARWFYVKSAHWSYEKEWRALIAAPGPVRISKRALKGIIVGCANTDANLELVREAVKGRRPKVALYKTVKKPREFGLDIVPVTYK